MRTTWLCDRRVFVRDGRPREVVGGTTMMVLMLVLLRACL